MIQLSDHFTFLKLIRFTIPSIGMMIFMSIYDVVDGFFVSNYVGNIPFASLNLIYPYLMIFIAIGFMFGAGGVALVGKTLGQGNRRHANEIFSLIIYAIIVLGAVFSVLGYMTAEPVARLLGASEEMIPYCVRYARVSLIGLIPFMLQCSFQSFMICAEKPRMGFVITIAAGVVNMVLDWLFMGVLGMGLESAAAASVIGQSVGGFIPLIYFIRPNRSLLRLGKTKLYMRAIGKTLTNGLSEFMSNISMSVVSMVYNLQLMRFAGPDGVAAYGIITYISFIFVGVYYGYSLGISPVISYNYGSSNKEELSNVFRKSLVIIGVAAVVLTGLAQVLARPLAFIFAGYDENLLSVTVTAERIYCISFLMMGFGIFGSAFFTALNNGIISALISTFRVLILQISAVLLLPMIFGQNGIWAAAVAAEFLAILITIGFLKHYRKRYGY